MTEFLCALMVLLMGWFLGNVQSHYSSEVAVLVAWGMLCGFGMAGILGVAILCHKPSQLPEPPVSSNTPASE